jgi:TRAP-type C4-dicarboxylate transport system permease small subunit
VKQDVIDPVAKVSPWGTFAAGLLSGLLGLVNRVLVGISAVALVVAGAVLTYGMFVRYWLHIPTDWQDELSVFLLVGATFFSAGYIQAQRGHIGIEALAEILSPRANRLRRYLADLFSFAFCLFFTWKSWTLLREAVQEGQVTQSTWGPPLWIPYGIMSVGMSVLTLQILLQLLPKPR